jgi:hypothetical protein
MAEKYEEWEPTPDRKPWKTSLVIVDHVRRTKEPIRIAPTEGCWLCDHCTSINPETRGSDSAGPLRLGFCLACYNSREANRKGVMA